MALAQEYSVIKINYPGSGNTSQFKFDASGYCVQIVENVGGTITSTKQFVNVGPSKTETRNSSGAVTAQFFGLGEAIGGTSYYWTKDALDSIHEMSDSAGTVVNQNLYDSFGKVQIVVGTVIADYQYAGYYAHSRSGYALTAARVYSANLGRWLSRDPAGEKAGTNLYAYVANDPVGMIDPSGLGPEGAILGGIAGSILGGAAGATIGGTGGAIAGPGGIVIGGGEAAVGGAIAGAGAGAQAGSAIQDMGNAMAGGFMDGCRRLGNAIKAHISNLNQPPEDDCDAVLAATLAKIAAHYDLMKKSDPEIAATEYSYDYLAARAAYDACKASQK